MKLIFMGTPALAVPMLDVLRAEHEVALVVTQPDKPAGRGHQLGVSPVKARALELGVLVAQPERARHEDFVAQLRQVTPEAIAVVAYGQILPRAILEMAPRGCINLHFSLLPRWRGAAPVQHALLAGDTQTGVSTQWMAEKLDAGDILLQRPVDILPHETTSDLWERLTPIGAELLRDSFRLIAAGTAPRVPQDERNITMAPSIRKEEGHFDWQQPAQSIVNRVRAMNPWPGAWCDWNGQALKVWRAETAPLSTSAAPEPGRVVGSGHDQLLIAATDGTVRLIEVQAPGRPRMAGTDWARGARLNTGDMLNASSLA